MAGQNTIPEITPMTSRNRKRMKASKPADDASRCTSTWCSSSSMSGKHENYYGQKQHEQNEDGRDNHVIGSQLNRVIFALASSEINAAEGAGVQRNTPKLVKET